MAEISREEFVRDYGRYLVEGRAAIFAGAGLSRAAGFVDWKELMREIASDLRLEIDREYDLVAVAQYHANERKSRAKLNETLIDKFTKDAQPTAVHSLMARLPIHTVWTTNYDTLIEEAFRQEHKRVDVKVEPENIAQSKRGTDVTVFKMHGDVSLPHKAVLTKEDYETYALTREMFTVKLKGDLVSQTFLFIGFSFSDPNIEYILSRIRGLLGQNTPAHYCIMRRPTNQATPSAAARAEYEYESRKLSLRVADLQRYGIQTLLIDDYVEIESIMQSLTRRAFLNNIFVSGSAVEGLPGFDLPRLQRFSRLLGKEIILRGFNLVSGFGSGIGSDLIVGALEAAYGKFSSLNDRLVLRPFPQASEPGTKVEVYREWRKAMLCLSGISVFVAGNKRTSSGDIALADGVNDEFDLGTSEHLHNLPIPVGVTGYMAKDLWEKVMQDPGRFYGTMDVRDPLRALGREAINDENIIAAIFDLVDKFSRVTMLT